MLKVSAVRAYITELTFANLAPIVNDCDEEEIVLSQPEFEGLDVEGAVADSADEGMFVLGAPDGLGEGVEVAGEGFRRHRDLCWGWCGRLSTSAARSEGEKVPARRPGVNLR